MKLRRILSAPAVQMAVIGVLVFAVDGLTHRRSPLVLSPTGKPVIEVPAGARGYAPQVFLGDEEPGMAADTASWLEQEVLYREAVKLGLERGDTIVRRRLIQKMEWLIAARLEDKTPTDDELRDLYIRNAQRYAKAAGYTFAHVFLAPGTAGQESGRAEKLLQQLNGAHVEPAQADSHGDPFLDGNRFFDVPDSDVVRRFGPDVAGAVAHGPKGRWFGPVASRFGSHLLHVERVSDGGVQPLTTVRERVLRDWLTGQRHQARNAAIAALLDNYEVIATAAPTEQARR